MATVLEPTSLIFSVVEKTDHHHIGYHGGEIRVDFDSDETAFITPCHKLEMTEDVQELLITFLKPLGIKYMRWWRDGHIIGRTFNYEQYEY